MKLVDLLLNQNVIIQLTWGEQKIEFSSNVIEKVDDVVYVSSYMHKGTELKLNVVDGTGVVCNVYADNSMTGQRISWRNVELTTEDRNGKTLYCIRTRGFNNIASPDDRRYNERTVIDIGGTVKITGTEEETNITVHDISGVGVSFYASKTYSPKVQQVTVLFTDIIDDRIFDVKVDCVITRMNVEEDRTTVGCKLSGENRDYQLYRFIKHLKRKNANKSNGLSTVNNEEESDLS